jgi:hypothetical protein
MTLVKGHENAGPPPKALMDELMKIGAEAMKKGVMIETGGLFPTAQGARVRVSGGKVTVIDGPFTEAKEVIGGYAVFEVNSKQEVIDETVRFMELHRKHWPGWEGETEIRQVFDAPDFAKPAVAKR